MGEVLIMTKTYKVAVRTANSGHITFYYENPLDAIAAKLVLEQFLRDHCPDMHNGNKRVEISDDL